MKISSILLASIFANPAQAFVPQRLNSQRSTELKYNLDQLMVPIGLVASCAAFVAVKDMPGVSSIYPKYVKEDIIPETLEAVEEKKETEPEVKPKRVFSRITSKPPAPAPVTIKAEEVVEETTVEEPTDDATVESNDSAEQEEATTSSVKSLNELKAEVGNTVEKTREYENRLKSAREAKEVVSEEAAPPAEEPAEPDNKETTKKRNKLRRVLRFTKKVIAPWRKWKNIS